MLEEQQRSEGRRRRALVTLIAATAMLAAAALAIAVPTMANSAKGMFASFDQCPISNSNVTTCVVLKTSGGHFYIGRTEVPVVKVLTLQGGINVQEEFVAAENGETLSNTPLAVPGGLTSILEPAKLGPAQAKYKYLSDNGMTEVTATLELVGQPVFNPSNLLQEEGVALSLPVRVHLQSPFLGNECYVGSQAHPITFNLTTGTTSPPLPNTAITGAAGDLEAEDGFELVIFRNDKLVDNAFSEPQPAGCGGVYAAEVDSSMETRLLLPAAGGSVETTLEDTLELATAQAVKTS
jgi:hypothetical protein